MLLLVREGVIKGCFKRSWCKKVLNLCLGSTRILLRNTVANSCTKSKENECFNWCVVEYLMLRLPVSENLVLSLCTCVRWKKKKKVGNVCRQRILRNVMYNNANWLAVLKVQREDIILVEWRDRMRSIWSKLNLTKSARFCKISNLFRFVWAAWPHTTMT